MLMRLHRWRLNCMRVFAVSISPERRSRIGANLVRVRNRHPACPGLQWERSSSQQAGAGGMTISFKLDARKSIKSQPLRMTILWEFDEKHPKQDSAYAAKLQLNFAGLMSLPIPNDFWEELRRFATGGAGAAAIEFPAAPKYEMRPLTISSVQANRVKSRASGPGF
jgi:hypothetical protein